VFVYECIMKFSIFFPLGKFILFTRCLTLSQKDLCPCWAFRCFFLLWVPVLVYWKVHFTCVLRGSDCSILVLASLWNHVNGSPMEGPGPRSQTLGKLAGRLFSLATPTWSPTSTRWLLQCKALGECRGLSVGCLNEGFTGRHAWNMPCSWHLC
jgi:hypothetical protein